MGARYLRYVIEETLLDVMYELPSLPEVVRCVVDREAIEWESNPKLMTKSGESLTIAIGPIQKTA